MRIKGVEFAGAIARPGGRPPSHLPQIAFSGRSNVGKSSLINRLLGRTRATIARVSSTPGRTQEINFFRVLAGLEDGRELEFYLVDLPGYGYARAPLEVRSRWRPLIESYLSGSEDLEGVVQLLDARHKPTAEDRRMVDYLGTLGVPTLFAVTKSDKLGREERARQVGRIIEALDLDEDQVIPFSARTGDGRDDLLESLAALLEGTEPPA